MPGRSRFLLLSARPEPEVREREFESVRSAGGLDDRLDTHRLDVAPLPDDVLDRYAGLVVGGSPFSVTDAEDVKSEPQRLAEASLRRLAEDALERDHPVFFTCFGIGVLSRVLGGVVDRSRPELVAAVEERLTDAGRSDAVAGVLPDRFFALTGHKEAAPHLPPRATLLATNDVSPVQLYRVGNVYASQFHPEPTIDDFVHRASTYSGYGYFPAAELEVITATLRAARVTEPRRLLRRFVEVYGA